MKKRCLVCALALVMALSMFGAAGAVSFTDMEGHWAKESVTTWADRGIFAGQGNGLFNPEGTVTRAQAAQIFSQLLGLTETADISAFTDVAGDVWYAPAIAKCVQAGILSGVSATQMNPEGQVTREMIFSMFVRAMGITEEKTLNKTWADADKISGWALGALGAMVNRGYVSGVGAGVLAPGNVINRASISALLSSSIAVYADKAGETVSKAADAKGLILVAAGDVTVTGAADTVVIAQGANGGKANVTGAAVQELTVSAVGAEVRIKDSQASKVLVTGKNSRVIFEGSKADAVTVSGQGVVVSVDEGSTVENVTVAQSGTDAVIMGGGTVKNVTTSGNGTAVGTANTVVKVTEGTTGVKAGGKEVGGGQTVTTGEAVEVVIPSNPGTPTKPEEPTEGYTVRVSTPIGDTERTILDVKGFLEDFEWTKLTFETELGDVEVDITKSDKVVDVVVTDPSEGGAAWNWLSSLFEATLVEEEGSFSFTSDKVDLSVNPMYITMLTGAEVQFGSRKITVRSDVTMTPTLSDEQRANLAVLYVYHTGPNVDKYLADTIDSFNKTPATIKVEAPGV